MINMLEEYMEAEEEEILMEMFSVSREWAADAIIYSKGDMSKIKEYLKRRAAKSRTKPKKCIMCGKMLTDPDSIARGYGAECYKKISTKDKTLFREVINVK